MPSSRRGCWNGERMCTHALHGSLTIILESNLPTTSLNYFCQLVIILQATQEVLKRLWNWHKNPQNSVDSLFYSRAIYTISESLILCQNLEGMQLCPTSSLNQCTGNCFSLNYMCHLPHHGFNFQIKASHHYLNTERFSYTTWSKTIECRYKSFW